MIINATLMWILIAALVLQSIAIVVMSVFLIDLVKQVNFLQHWRLYTKYKFLDIEKHLFVPSIQIE